MLAASNPGPLFGNVATVVKVEKKKENVASIVKVAEESEDKVPRKPRTVFQVVIVLCLQCPLFHSLFFTTMKCIAAVKSLISLSSFECFFLLLSSAPASQRTDTNYDESSSADDFMGQQVGIILV